MFLKYASILLLFFVQVCFSQNDHLLVIDHKNLGISSGQNVGVFVDDEKKYSNFSDLKNLPNDAFKTLGTPILDFNFTAKRYWLKFSVNNQSEFQQFILEVGRTVTNKVEFFEVKEGEVVHHFISGDDFAYDDKEIAHRKNLFPIILNKNETKTFYLMLESDGELLFSPIMVHERLAFFEQDFKDQFKNGFYYGLIALVVIIYFFFFVFLKDKTFLFYILYAFSQGILQFSLDGYSHHHFFPNGGYFANHVLLVFAGLTVIFLLTYVNNFLQLKETSLRLWKVFRISRFVLILIVLMSLVPGTLYEIAFPIINGASLFGVLLAAFSILRLLAKGIKVDLFFAIAFIILILGGVVFILGNLSIVGDKLISLGALKISSAVEFVILSISMSNKYGKLQQEKEEAQQLAFQNLQEKNALMDQSNVRLERQVKERTAEIEKQRAALSKSNEEIVSSIKYAKRIQQAILPSDEHISERLPNSFVFYRPKDVVSGDFYFVESAQTSDASEQKYTLFAAVDCTGHGVPGAFMSIVGNNLLTQSLTEHQVNSPGEALSFLNAGLNKTLRHNVEGTVVRDGMDIAMCAISADKSQLIFSGAKNPLYLIRFKANLNESDLLSSMEILEETDDRVLIQIKGDRTSIGSGQDDMNYQFENHYLNLFKGDQIYVFTDGFADQFGGENGKKYNYSRFRKYLLSIAETPISDREAILNLEFTYWLGNLEQIDDVLVIGVEV